MAQKIDEGKQGLRFNGDNMKDHYKLYKWILGIIYLGTYAIFVLAIKLSTDSEPPVMVIFAGAFFAALAVISNILIDLSRDFHSTAQDLKELVKHNQARQDK